MTINTVGVTVVCCFWLYWRMSLAPHVREACVSPELWYTSDETRTAGGGGGLPRLRKRVHRRAQPVQLGIFSPGKRRRYYQADKVHVQHPSWFHTRSRTVFIRECAELLEKLSEDVRPAKKKKKFRGAHTNIAHIRVYPPRGRLKFRK